jgi:hypothetical protein
MIHRFACSLPQRRSNAQGQRLVVRLRASRCRVVMVLAMQKNRRSPQETAANFRLLSWQSDTSNSVSNSAMNT